MKKLYTLFSIMIAVVAFAQAPQGFNYQATVRNSAGVLIVNQNVNFKFNIMLNSQTSVPIYSETHFAPTDDLGQVNLTIGQGTATVGTFSGINWANGSYYLGIEINTGSGYVAMGTTQLLSVPYALYANSSGNSNFNFPNGTNIGDTLNWIWNGSAWVPTSSVSNAQLPVISTIVATNTLTPSPSSGGTITSDGGYSITSKGVCWSTSPNPTISNNSTNNGTGASNFTSILSNLLPTTSYYYRAYATNSIGTSYGITYTFTTAAIAQLTTTTVTTITSSTASSGGTISSDGGATITAKGVCWSTSPNPTTALTTKTNNGTGTATYSSSISGLLPITTYYIRAYATTSYGTAYGQEEVITTIAATPVITTTSASLITSSSASSGGVISSDGGASIIARGIVWSTTTLSPTIAINEGLTSDGAGIGTFTSLMSQLTHFTNYYIRAYATNSAGTSYGDYFGFRTLPVAPSISTTSVSGTTYFYTYSGGTISSDGGATITAKGVCWSTSPNPTIALTTKTNNGTGTATFTSTISGLTPVTSYYVRAYATNSAGTSYGQEVVFTTLAIQPTLTTTVASAITSSTASSGGAISSDGGATITAKGVCWSTSTNPTIALTTKTNDGTGTATFTSSISSLTPGTMYYVRAYATNSVGTSYGNEITFSALALIPTLTTTSASSITSSTASSGGAISSDGGAIITAKGVCWSTSPNPTTALTTKTNNGTGTATYSSNINVLIPGTIYYARAYATNSVGTAYGQEVIFTTLAILPTITTEVASSISITTANSGGTISNDGGATITDRGIVWSTITNPSIVSNQGLTSNGTGIGAFTSNMTSLTHNTTYYVRAYATNSVGTAYGQEIVFITSQILNVPGPNLTDIDGNVYNTITIGNQTWTKKNLNVSKYRNGDVIPQVTDATQWDSLTTGAWCYYSNNSSNGTTYGKLYNWYAVNDPRGLAPVGYHIPSQAEWNILINYLGGSSVAGGKMKEVGTTHWLSPNTGATNISGFTGLPGGYKIGNGTFYSISDFGYWWSSTAIPANEMAGAYYLRSNIEAFGTGYSGYRFWGESVRLIKD